MSGSNSGFNPDTMDPGLAPIKISDAASMFRRPIDPNERPYTQAMIRRNNKYVDEWYNLILKKIASKTSEIRAGQVYGEWQYFYYGKILPGFIAAIKEGHASRPSEKAVDHWVKLFTSASIEDLAELGPAAVGHGWKLVTDENYIRGSLEKWDKIYSKSDDPLVWRKLAHDNAKLWSNDFSNYFWSPEQLQDISQKVTTVLRIDIAPRY